MIYSLIHDPIKIAVMSRILTVLVGLICALFTQSVMGVDRKIFKSCVQSGFCNRNRIIAEHILNGNLDQPWKVQEIKTQGSHLDFTLVRLTQQLSAKLKLLNNGALKLSIDTEAYSERYQIPKGDVISDDSESSEVFQPLEDDTLKIESAGLSVKISKDPFSLSVISETDGTILELNSKNLFHFESGQILNLPDIIKTIDSKKNNELWTEPRFGGGIQDSRKKGPMSFGLDINFVKSKAIYGIPEHASSLALKSTRGIDDNNRKVFTRSDPYRLFNLDVFEYELDSTMALYGAIPIMLGHDPHGSNHRSVGVFWNNPSETWVDVYEDAQSEEKLTHWMSESGSFSLYIFAGKNLKEIQKTIKSLTGSPQLPPTFALGYHQCRWNYKSVDDVLEVHKNFDEHALPVDVIWLDIEHTDDKKYMSWHPTNFEEPERMLEELGRTGRKLVTIVDPHMKKDHSWEIYREIIEKNLAVKASDGKSAFEGDCWPGKSVWTDYTNPEARNWWASLFSFDKYKVKNNWGKLNFYL